MQIVMRSDNAQEFLSRKVHALCDEYGVTRELSCAFSSFQNGGAERAIRSACQRARTMIIAAEMPIRFWPDALNSATRIHNLLPCASRKFQSPNQIETGSVTPAEIMSTHIFESRCFVHLTPNEKTKASKMKPFAWRGVYLGKAIGKEGHLVWCEQRKAAFVRDSVTFDDGKHWLSHHLKPGPDELVYKRETKGDVILDHL
jgi:hypothetical protein